MHELALLPVSSSASPPTSPITRVTSTVSPVATAMLIAPSFAKRVEVTVPLIGPTDTRRVGANVVEKARLVVGSSLALRLRRLLLLSDDARVWGTFGFSKFDSVLRLPFVFLRSGSLHSLSLLLESCVPFREVKLRIWDGWWRDVMLGLPAAVAINIEVR